jgi:anti-anti-sigma factor
MTAHALKPSHSPLLKPSHSPLLMPPSASACRDVLGLRVEIRLGVRAVAEVSGDIDIATAPWLRETLLLAIQRYGPAIDVDLHGVTFLDCAGVNALLATARRARLEGGQARVTRLSAPAWRVITLLGLQNLLPEPSPELRAHQNARTTAGLRFRAAVGGGRWLRAACSLK